MTKKIKIRVWQLENNITQEEIAKKSGVSQAYVSLVISGRRKSKKVVDALIAKGCPKIYFNQEIT